MTPARCICGKPSLRALHDRLTERLDYFRLGAQLSRCNAMQLDLAQRGRVVAPLGYGRLLNPQGRSYGPLGLEMFDSLLLRHVARI